MNRIQKILGLIGVLGASTPLFAGDFRAPLVLSGYHWFLPEIEDAWWYDMLPEHRGERIENWHIRTWKTLYARSAGNAFERQSDCCDEESSSKNTRHTEPLSVLLFGDLPFHSLGSSGSGGSHQLIDEEQS